MTRLSKIIMVLYGMCEGSSGEFVDWLETVPEGRFWLDRPFQMRSKELEPGIYRFVGWAGWSNPEGIAAEGVVFLVECDAQCNDEGFDFQPLHSLRDTLESCPSQLEGIMQRDTTVDGFVS